MEVDPREVLRFLDFPCVGTPEPVSGGWDTSIWRFTSPDGAQHALRLHQPGREEVARRELLVMEVAAAGGVPIARAEAHGVWRDRSAFVLEWAAGDPLTRCVERWPWTLWRLAAAFAQVQALIHRAPVPTELRFGSPENWLRADELRDDTLIERLRALPPATETLVHLDYHPLNVLAEGTRISAVIDWTNGAAGDRRADVARTAALIALAPIPAGSGRPVLVVARRLFYSAWWRGYRALSGPLPALAPFMAWAGLKFQRDTERRLGQSHVWATERDLVPMRRWVARWKARADIV